MATNYYSTGVGTAPQGVSINNNRRLYDFGNRIAMLDPEEALFFAYLNRLSKNPTTDPVFKMLERRASWQRRNFEVGTSKTGISIASPTTIADFRLTVHHDQYGRVVTSDEAPLFLLPNQTVSFECEINDGAGGAYVAHRAVGRIIAIGSATSTYQAVTVVIRSIDGDLAYATTYTGKTMRAVDGKRGQVTGTAFAEATGAPDGWTDSLYDREGYTQIFKTSVPIVSGSTMATEYRGIQSEWDRIWRPKMKEHRHDVGQACMFGVGEYAAEDGSGDPKRFTWGALPYIEAYGEVKSFSYGATNYDNFIDWFRLFFDKRKGGSRSKMAYTSSTILAWMAKLGDHGFLSNSVGPGAYQIQVTNLTATFFPGTNYGEHEIVVVRTPFGRVGFVEEQLLSDMYEDYALILDMPHLAYRPLRGNGISRDTFVKTNVQNNDLDGRKDMILTEAGLEVDLPELHAVLHFQ